MDKKKLKEFKERVEKTKRLTKEILNKDRTYDECIEMIKHTDKKE